MSILFICASLIVTDGDTVKCNGLPYRLIGDGVAGKTGFDTPEIFRPKCFKERQLGHEAKERVEELVKSGKFRMRYSGEKGYYKRRLGSLVNNDGQTIGRILIGEGLAVEWPRPQGFTWCK